MPYLLKFVFLGWWFALLTASSAFAITATVYIDGNSNGQYDPGEDDNTFSNGNGGGTHDHAFDIPATGNPSSGEVIIDFDFIDNSMRVVLNGTDICAPSICQLQGNAFNAATQSFLTFVAGDFQQPWRTNTNGLPRLRVIINSTGLTLLGTRTRTSTSLDAVILSSGSLNSPGFVANQNDITVINPNDTGPDGTNGDISASYDPYSPSLEITKTADQTVNVAAGVTVVYTYVVLNDGDAPISNINLSDIHGGSGTAPVPGNESLTADNGTTGDSSNTVANDGIWDVLGPGDEITFTAEYVVTQNDVDTLQ